MLPGSMLPPGLQVAASDSRKTVCENEEEYAQKYGRVLDRQRIRKHNRLRGLMGATVVIAILCLRFLFMS
jgi:hypothetical protein